LIHALNYRDHDTWDHSTRVAAYATALAEHMGLPQSELEKIALAGYLHDIGKIGVPDRILLKKSNLLPEEWETIKRHPELGYEIIHELEFLNSAADIILLHHERYDGSGYPLGLRGEKIPLLARIFSVADALDAMTSERPYRAARSMAEAFGEVRSLAGVQFCPKCVKALEELGVENLSQIQQRAKDHKIKEFQPEDLIPSSDII
jgi:putative nucleotidyltransferase with HDIG domain